MTSVETRAPSIITYTSMVFSAISMIGATFVFISYVSHKRLQTFTFRLILWFSMFDFLVACSTIWGPLGTLHEESESDTSGHAIDGLHGLQSNLSFTCQAQAAVIQFGSLASLLWTACFAIHLLRITRTDATVETTHRCRTHIIYAIVSIVIPAVITILMFYKGLVGVSGDFWCYIDTKYVSEYAWKYLYIEVSIIIICLLLIYIGMRCRLRHLHNQPLSSHILVVNRRSFLRSVAGGLSAYLGAPIVSYVPAHFNWICTKFGLESMDHVISWYVLSAILLGVLHVGIFCIGISLVRQSWLTCCDKSPRVVRSLRESEQFYMELV